MECGELWKYRDFFPRLIQRIRKGFKEELTIDLNLKEIGRIYIITKRYLPNKESMQDIEL